MRQGWGYDDSETAVGICVITCLVTMATDANTAGTRLAGLIVLSLIEIVLFLLV